MVELAELTHGVGDHFLHGGLVGDVGLQGNGLASEGADLRGDFFGFFRVRSIVDGHVGTLFGKNEGASPTDSARSPRDQCDPSSKPRHAILR